MKNNLKQALIKLLCAKAILQLSDNKYRLNFTANIKLTVFVFFFALISCKNKITEHIAPNFDSLLKSFHTEKPVLKIYDKNTATVDFFATQDSTSFGFYCKKYVGETYIYHFYSKDKKFYKNNVRVYDTTFNPYTGGNSNYELYKKIFNKKIYFGYEEDNVFSGVYAFTKNDSSLIGFESDTSTAEIFSKYGSISEYFESNKTYRKQCRQNDTGTIYRFFINDVMGNIFRLYKSNGGIFIMRYGQENVKQNNEVVASPYKQGIKYEYLDEKYKKEAKEFFYKPNKSLSIYQIDAETNMPFDSGAVYTSPWKYDWSRVDSLFYKHKL